MRILLRAGYDSYSGYGRDATDLAVNLSRHDNVQVVPWPIELLPGLPRSFTDLLTGDPRGGTAGTPFDVAVCFSDPWRLDPTLWADLAPKAVGYTMWEADRILPADMLPDPATQAPGAPWTPSAPDRWYSDTPDPEVGRRRALDLLVVTCPMNVDAFNHLDPHVPKAVVPCGIDPNIWEFRDRANPQCRYPGPVRFGVVGQFVPRKAVFTLLEVWRDLKASHPGFDATLDVKDSGVRLHPLVADAYGPGLTIHHGTWDHHTLADFYHHCDALVSVSRGEGNDKPLMESMATGCAAIGTDWSAHQNYLTPDVGWPLPGRLTQANPAKPTLDFEVDRDQLAATLLEVAADQGECARRGANAAGAIQDFAWRPITRRFLDELDRVCDQ